MIEVIVDSILASMMSEHRLLILKEVEGNRHLPMWIGQYEADAIIIGLRQLAVPRPLTHDLLAAVIAAFGGRVSHVEIYDLDQDTFLAHIIIESGKDLLRIDARPSDAVALAVRLNIPVFVADEVMDNSSVTMEADLVGEGDTSLTAFRDFVDTLNLDDLPAQ